MQLPIQAQPILRKTSTSVAMGGVTPLECTSWYGTAPFCGAHCSQCPDGWRCDTSDCGDGACCWSGQKVRCCPP